MTHVKQWYYQILATLHSVLSWMRWRQRSRQRQELERLRQMAKLETLLQQHLEDQRQLLLEALTPLAQALQRQDSQRQQQHQEQKELLLETLNSLQPTAMQQLLPATSIPPRTSPPWGR